MTSGKQKRKHIFRHTFNYSLSFILTAVFLYVAFHDVDFNEVLEEVSNASIFYIIVFAVALMFTNYIRAWRWKIILKSVKPDAKYKNLFGAMMVGYGVNNVVPRLGEVSRAVLIGKWEGLSRSSMFGTVILERIIDIIFLGLAIIISLAIWTENLHENFPWLKSTLYITIAILAAIILFIYLLVKFKAKFYNGIVKLIGKISEKLAKSAGHIFEMLTEGFGSLKGTKNYINVFLISALIMILYALTSYIGFYTVGMQNIKSVDFGMAWVLMSISAIGVVIPTPGGTGSYHTLAKSVLVLLFGFNEVISLSYAFLTHIISYFLFIIVALISFFVLNKQHDNLIKVVETEVDEL